jgi:hypothetical protein
MKVGVCELPQDLVAGSRVWREFAERVRAEASGTMNIRAESGVFRSQVIERGGRRLGAVQKSPESHPIPGNKNKVLAAEDRQAPHLGNSWRARQDLNPRPPGS